MADLPILFVAAMVRALLREIEQPGTGKTQTRQVLNPQPIYHGLDTVPSLPTKRVYTFAEHLLVSSDNIDACTPYEIGDRLYVREAWHAEAVYDDTPPRDIPHDACCILYKSDQRWSDWDEMTRPGKLRPPMFMMKWMSRITLIVEDVRVQRLQDISKEDAIAEGVLSDSDGWRDYLMPSTQCCTSARDSFRTLWDSLNAKRAHNWQSNPWVAAYTFAPILGNIDSVGAS